MICCDMDGTLLNQDSILTEKTADTVRRYASSGIIFAIASGRMMHRIDRHTSSFLRPEERYYIADNGAVVISRGKKILERTFPVRPYRDLFLEYIEKGLEIDLDYDDSYRPLIETERTRRKSDHFRGYDRPLGTGDEVWNLEVNKISATDPVNDGKLQTFLDRMREIGGCSVFQYGIHATEIGPAGCSKMTGIETLADALGIKLSEILAIGDHTNDIEMLSRCGYSAAVGNSVREAKEAACYVCSLLYGDGVIEALEHFSDFFEVQTT